MFIWIEKSIFHWVGPLLIFFNQWKFTDPLESENLAFKSCPWTLTWQKALMKDRLKVLLINVSLALWKSVIKFWRGHMLFFYGLISCDTFLLSSKDFWKKNLAFLACVLVSQFRSSVVFSNPTSESKGDLSLGETSLYQLHAFALGMVTLQLQLSGNVIPWKMEIGGKNTENEGIYWNCNEVID